MPQVLSPRRLHKQISIQQIGAETLVYDESRHKAFCLNESSSVIWNLANGERSIAQIVAEASDELRASLNEEFVCFALAQLRRDGLMEPSSVPQASPAITRRAVLQRLSAGTAMLLPAVAAILAPTAAQAYSGCVDCDVEPAKARRQQRSVSRPLLLPDPDDPTNPSQ